MKHPGPYIRAALVTLLNNTINYDGQDVPVYEGEGELVQYQIMLAEQTGTEQDDRASFNTEFEQLIEVVSRQAVNTRKHVDAIGASMMQLLKPTPQAKGIPDSADFQIRHLQMGRPSYQVEQEDDGSYINVLQLRITFSITEK